MKTGDRLAVYLGDSDTPSFIVNAPDAAPTFTPDGKVALPDNLGTIDPATGLASLTAGGASLQVGGGGTPVSISAAGAYPQVTVGGSTISFNGSDGGVIAVGDGAVSFAAGARITGGGENGDALTVVAPAGAESVFSVPGGTRLTVGEGVAATVSGAGSAQQVTVDGMTLVLGAETTSLLSIGTSVVSIPPGSAIERLAGGGVRVTPPADAGATISGEGGALVELAAGLPAVFKDDGQGGLSTEVGDRIIAMDGLGAISESADGLPAMQWTTADGGTASTALDNLIAAYTGPLDAAAEAQIDAALGWVDRAPELPDTTDPAAYASWADEQVEISTTVSDEPVVPPTQRIINLAGDPSILALRDAMMAGQFIAAAINAPSTESVLRALDATINAAAAIGQKLDQNFLQTTALQLGIEDDIGTGWSDVQGPPAPGAESAAEKLEGFLAEGTAALNTLLSIKAAVEQPSLRTIAGAVHQAAIAGMVFDPGMKLDLAKAMEVYEAPVIPAGADAATIESLNAAANSDATQVIDNVMAGAGAAISVIAACENPTPQSVVSAGLQVYNAIMRDAPIPYATEIAAAIGFISNPSVESAVSAAGAVVSYYLWTYAASNAWNPSGWVAAAAAVVITVFTGGGGKPIVLDMDGNGVKLVPVGESLAHYDLDGDRWTERRGWVGAGDGLLAFDANEDGAITGRDELCFTGYREGARTDLEGLVAFDSNHDGVLSAADAEWSKFKVWLDDGDGVSEAGEVKTMAEAGIASITLASDGVQGEIAGNTVFGQGSFTKADGSTGVFADVALTAEPAVAHARPGEAGWQGPLVLNLLGNAVTTLDRADLAVSFDMNADGTMERTGWIAPDQGFLVVDGDRDAAIEDGSELVGGFSDLAGFDANADGRVDSADAAWTDLKVWVDKNRDGKSQRNELYGLAQLGIASIGVAAAASGRYDSGNIVTAEGHFTFSDGATGQIAAVDLGGLSADGTLLYVTDDSTTLRMADGRVAQYLTGSGITVNAARSGLDVVIDQGSHNTLIAGNSRGAVLIGGDGSTLIGGSGADTLIAKGDGLSVKAGSGSAFIELDGAGNTVTATAGAATVVVAGADNSIAMGAGEDSVRIKAARGGFVVGLDASTGEVLVTDTDASDGDFGTTVLDGVEAVRFADDTVWTDSLTANPVTGTSADETLAGTAGRDRLSGLGGADRLEGGAGDDVYVFGRGDGADVVADTAGMDTLEFGAGISLSDISARLVGADLVVAVADPANPDLPFSQVTERLTLTGWADHATRIERFRFADGTIQDAAGIVGRLGSNQADTIGWDESALAVNAGAGDDTVTGSVFGDTLAGGTGNDTLVGGVEPPPTVSIGSAATVEGMDARIPVRLSRAADGDVTVAYTVGGTDGTLVIPAGQTVAYITVATATDAITGDNETLTATLSAATGATLGAASATVTILDGTNRTGDTLEYAWAASTNAEVTVTNGGMTATVDKNWPGGSGDGIEAIRLDNPIKQGKWYFEMRAESTGWYRIAALINGSQDGLLQTESGAWSLSNGVTKYTVNDTDGGNNIAAGKVVGVAIDATNLSDIKVWTSVNNSWLSGNPTASSSPVMSGSASTYFALWMHDVYAGYKESWTLNDGSDAFAYSAPSGFAAINSAAAFTFTATDEVLDLTSPSAAGASLVHAIDLTGNGGQRVSLSAAGVNALAPDTHALRISGEAGDRVVFTDAGWGKGASSGGYTTWSNGAASVMLQDGVSAIDTTLPTVAIGNAATIEGMNARIPVTLSHVADRDVTVSYTLGGGSASVGSDYAGGSGTLTIAAGQTMGWIKVATAADAAAEANETLTATLSAATGATLGAASATVTILDGTNRTGDTLEYAWAASTNPEVTVSNGGMTATVDKNWPGGSGDGMEAIRLDNPLKEGKW
ncbi:MAG: hypothetical protein EPN20_03615, partial [Magnetospirillum sp.]